MPQPVSAFHCIRVPSVNALLGGKAPVGGGGGSRRAPLGYVDYSAECDAYESVCSTVHSWCISHAAEYAIEHAADGSRVVWLHLRSAPKTTSTTLHLLTSALHRMAGATLDADTPETVVRLWGAATTSLAVETVPESTFFQRLHCLSVAARCTTPHAAEVVQATPFTPLAEHDVVRASARTDDPELFTQLQTWYPNLVDATRLVSVDVAGTATQAAGTAAVVRLLCREETVDGGETADFCLALTSLVSRIQFEAPVSVSFDGVLWFDCRDGLFDCYAWLTWLARVQPVAVATYMATATMRDGLDLYGTLSLRSDGACYEVATDAPAVLDMAHLAPLRVRWLGRTRVDSAPSALVTSYNAVFRSSNTFGGKHLWSLKYS